MVDHTLGRVLDLFDIDLRLVRRWSGKKEKSKDTHAEPISLDEKSSET